MFAEFFEGNPDQTNPQFNTQLGMYTQNCGLDALLMSWGHDELMYVASGVFAFMCFF